MQNLTFVDYCRSGDLANAKKYLELHPEFDIHINNEKPFYSSCANGHLEVAQWLWSLDQTTKIHDAFVISCINGHLEMAKWLVDLSQPVWNLTYHQRLGSNRYICFGDRYSEAFRLSCANGHLEVAKFLLSLNESIVLGPEKIPLEEFSYREETYVNDDDDYAFRFSCANGHLDVAQWLWDMEYSCISMHAYQVALDLSLQNKQTKVSEWLCSLGNLMFGKFCEYGEIDLAQWLLNLNVGVDIRDDDDYAFRVSCYSKRLNVVKWLCTLCNEYSYFVQNREIHSVSHSCQKNKSGNCLAGECFTCF